jgi:hypothetical protein
MGASGLYNRTFDWATRLGEPTSYLRAKILLSPRRFLLNVGFKFGEGRTLASGHGVLL